MIETSWAVTVPGSPPSSNHAYRPVIQRRNGVPYRTLAKTPEVVAYQQAARLIVKAAKPSGWQPDDQVRIRVKLYVSGRQDADNSLKMLLDSVAKAIGVDDIRFLPCIESKEIVKPKDARAELLIG